MRTLLIIRHVAMVGAILGGLHFGRAQSLEDYVATGVKNNLVLQQRQISLEKALWSLKTANALFVPAVSIQGNYTSGEGGRSIALPIGDMLNPVYTSLNQLTDSQNFPLVQNVEQTFFPYNFYDAKVHATMPLVNTDLIYTRRVKRQQVLLEEFEVEIYQRELVRDIKAAYFTYLSSRESIAVYQNALIRANENKRVNESLLRNGKGLPAYVLRSNSEIESIRAQVTAAEKQAENAKHYFNFLINVDEEAEINTAYRPDLEALKTASFIDSSAVTQREEIKLMNEAISLQQQVLKMNRLYWMPRIGGFADVGTQSENWKFNSRSRYYLVGLQVDIPLFTGFHNQYKIKQSSLDVSHTNLEKERVRQQVALSSRVAYNALVTSSQNYQSSLKQLEAARSYHHLIEKGYQEGTNTFIETLDARTQLTNAQLAVTLNEYNCLIAVADFERETASYPLEK